MAAPTSELKKQATENLVIVLLGPPGAGKGTQAAMLSKALQVPHIATGTLLRLNIKEETILGKAAKAYMDEGKLVPDELILDMLFSRVSEKDCLEGYILDGFPRTLKQAQIYHERLSEGTKTIAVNLALSDDNIIKRLGNRVICSDCNAPFHIEHSPPKQKGTCDYCNNPLIQRIDDKEEVIQKRLIVYHNQTAPLLTYYSKQQNLKEIICDQAIDNILQELLAIIPK